MTVRGLRTALEHKRMGHLSTFIFKGARYTFSSMISLGSQPGRINLLRGYVSLGNIYINQACLVLFDGINTENAIKSNETTGHFAP